MRSAKSRVETMRAKKAAREGGAYTPAKVSEPVPLMPENKLVWAIFETERSQVIVGGMTGVLGIKHDNLQWLFGPSMFRVPEREHLETLQKFVIVEHIYVHAMNEGKGRAGGSGKSPHSPAPSKGRRHSRH